MPWTSTCRKNVRVSLRSARTPSQAKSTCLPWILDPLIPPSKVSPRLVPFKWRELLTMSCSKDAIEALANSPENITDPNVFDVYRSYLKCAEIWCYLRLQALTCSHRHSGSLSAGVMNKLHDSLSSMMSVEIEAAARDMDSADHHVLAAHKTPLEMYAFLINWISSAAESVKTLGEEGATALKPKVCSSFQHRARPLKCSREDAPPRPVHLQGTQKGKMPGAGRIKSLRRCPF